MADLLEQAASWLDGMRQAHLSRPVLYCRDDECVEVQATIGKTVFEVETGYGVVERIESRDFLIAADLLVLDYDLTMPRRGDRIKETVGEQTFVYEVMAPGNEDCWRYSDPFRRTLRVHTKFVGQE
jgi:hypothetical protein